jgi:bifunctional DNA-binding transcriptional regulator/antitoxin component of YhaV-PrlF toxin-antitoxin module
MTLSESRVSRGFLTVVPKGIRRAAAITVGDVLEWEMDEDRVVVRKRKRRTLSAWLDSYPVEGMPWTASARFKGQDSVLLDISLLVGLADRKDQWHPDARRVAKQLPTHRTLTDLVVADRLQ